MPFTRVQLQTRLQNFLNNSTYWTPDDLNDSIQDGFDELAAYTGCIYNSATIPFTQGTSYYDMLSLLPDYIGVVAIFNAVIKRWLIPTSLKKLEIARWDWETAYGTPYYFVPVNHRYIAVFLKPNVPNYGNFYIFYRASAPTLNDASTIAIPDDHIEALENYVITDMWEQNQEFSKASDWLQNSYIPRAEALRTYIESKRNPNRIQRLMD